MRILLLNAGSYGTNKEFLAEKFYQDVKVGKIYVGTLNIQSKATIKNH
jgi:alkylation response protein AidB-like acyl-CoA dehydrogenase